jgi:preprotein translocase subunit SecA
VYLNALEGKGVHVVTVNDYLARRDAAWMGKLYNWLGLSVGVVYPGMPHSTSSAAYAADITYGTNNEFGFDYLRDNMALSKEDRFQRGLQLRDRRRSRLDPDRRGAHPADHLRSGRRIARAVHPGQPHRAAAGPQEKEDGDGDFWVDEKGKQVHLSEAGMEHAEELLRGAGILARTTACTAAEPGVVHHLNAALRAHAIYQRDVDYIVRDGEVVIVDEFTGRTLAGRRWSDGLHQAVEAKEGVPVQRENQTLASGHLPEPVPHVQQAVRHDRHGRHRSLRIPEHLRPGSGGDPDPQARCMRKDSPDQVFLNRAGKFRAVLADIKDCAASAASRCWWAPPRSRPRNC